MLRARGFGDMRLVFPPPKWCTDNAAMIAWAGIEMFNVGYTTSFTARAVRKWPLDQLLAPPDQ
jgi:N6-L-threonylcarbamoyladenine synthase